MCILQFQALHRLIRPTVIIHLSNCIIELLPTIKSVMTFIVLYIVIYQVFPLLNMLIYDQPFIKHSNVLNEEFFV